MNDLYFIGDNSSAFGECEHESDNVLKCSHHRFNFPAAAGFYSNTHLSCSYLKSLTENLLIKQTSFVTQHLCSGLACCKMKLLRRLMVTQAVGEIQPFLPKGQGVTHSLAYCGNQTSLLTVSTGLQS